jgi:hypothetical protein
LFSRHSIVRHFVISPDLMSFGQTVSNYDC